MSRRWAAILVFLALAASDARADDVADFYRGKLIKVVVGFASGGGYDVYARLLARHLGKYIPGNPGLVVQNMVGAGGLRAANFVYSAAPKDGTTIGILSRDMPLLAVLGANAAVQFDPRKFTWIGSSSSFVDDAYVLMVRADAPAASIAEARRPGRAAARTCRQRRRCAGQRRPGDPARHHRAQRQGRGRLSGQ